MRNGLDRLATSATITALFSAMMISVPAQAGTITESKNLRNKIIAESGIQAFGPNPVRGAWELYLLGKQLWWAGKAGLFSYAPSTLNPTSPVLVASRPVPTFTPQEVQEAFGNIGTASPTITNLFNNLAAVEEPLAANTIAFNTALASHTLAQSLGDTASAAARLAEANVFSIEILGLSLQSSSIIDSIVSQHTIDGLGNPILTLTEASDFITAVQTTGLPASERQGLLDLGLQPSLLSQSELFIGQAAPTDAAGLDLMGTFTFIRSLNDLVPAEVADDLANPFRTIPEPSSLVLTAFGLAGLAGCRRRWQR